MESHVRIDEGVKRGPRIPPSLPPALQAPRNPSGVSNRLPEGFDFTTVIDRYLDGERTADIAQSLGVHRTALNYHLLRNLEDDWKHAQVAIGLTDLQQAENDLEVAPDALALARAREQLRGAQWRLERLCARIFGQQSHITVELTGDLGDRLRRSRERIIEGECVALAPLVPQVIDSPASAHSDQNGESVTDQ